MTHSCCVPVVAVVGGGSGVKDGTGSESDGGGGGDSGGARSDAGAEIQPKKVRGFGFGDIFKDKPIKLRPRSMDMDNELEKVRGHRDAYRGGGVMMSQQFNMIL